MKISYQTALITGSSRGHGRGIAVKLAQEGVKKIAIHYLNRKDEAEQNAGPTPRVYDLLGPSATAGPSARSPVIGVSAVGSTAVTSLRMPTGHFSCTRRQCRLAGAHWARFQKRFPV